MKSSWKTILLWSLPIFIISFFVWQGFLLPNNTNFISNTTNSRMTYGRFLEYLDMGWIKKIDLYDKNHTALVEAIGPELGNQVQKIRVELPTNAPGLINKLKKAQVDINANPNKNTNTIWNLISNLFFPVLIIGGIAVLFKRSNSSASGPGQALSFGKTKALFQVEAQTGIIFNDVAGVDEAKEEFQEIVTFLKQPDSFTAVGAKIPKGILLIGPPGTGKTLLAKAIAGEANVPFFSISGSEFVEMFVGVGASRVRDLFKKAKESAPCIIFIDEIDAVGRQRGTGIGGGNDEREQTLNQLLTEMDGFEGNTGIIIIAATNRADILDAALLRPGRFDRQVTVNIPDINGRCAILKVHAKNKKLSSNISIKTIAKRTPGFSGADLANLLNEAAILTARRYKKAITIAELDTSIDRVIAGMEGTPLINNKSKRLIAYHEIGHAIIGTLLPNHDPVQKVTLIPRGQAKGLTWFTPTNDQNLISKTQILSKIMGALGGRATEEIVFGNTEVTTGASNDLQQVTVMARQMVTRFGMSLIGPLSLENENSNPFLGRNISNNNEYSDTIVIKIDKQIEKIVSECYQKVLKLIEQNRVVIDKLVDILIEQETIEGYKLEEIITEYTKIPFKIIY
jgi:cell division protease FtsH|uniref:ATP-dependent zinc metalloprotease FtsH n=1 Tax=Thorea hispida TaxID=202687 RepID=A0A1C9CAQ7_9FLOR|nr:cell division protein [Thorea hispida]AOM65449.1 cell division protein [Thorea hispida]ARX95818.1 cell division protein [Thorea hispida]UNJ79108.1 cell division protein [Thorea hispida]